MKQFQCCHRSLIFSSTMSDESDYSDSEFYYPDELSDAELFQLPTYSESEESGKSKLLTNEEVPNFIRSQQQASTVKKKQATTGTIFSDSLMNVGRNKSFSKFRQMNSTNS